MKLTQCYIGRYKSYPELNTLAQKYLEIFYLKHHLYRYFFRGESSSEENPFRSWYGRLGEVRSLVECPVILKTATANAAA